MGSTFFALAFLAFSSLTTVDLLIAERQVVTREVRGGYYHPAAYLLSKLTLDGREFLWGSLELWVQRGPSQRCSPPPACCRRHGCCVCDADAAEVRVCGPLW